MASHLMICLLQMALAWDDLEDQLEASAGLECIGVSTSEHL